MSVTIERSNGEIYVNAKPENLQKGSLGGGGVHIKCENEEQAQELAAKFKKAEEEITKQIQQEVNAKNVNLNESAPNQGVAEKLDIKAA
jgi:hypothetical protein